MPAGPQPRPAVAGVTAYLTPEQAAQRLPVGNADWWREQCRKGRVRGSKVGGRWLIEESAIEELVEAGSNSTRRRRKRVTA